MVAVLPASRALLVPSWARTSPKVVSGDRALNAAMATVCPVPPWAMSTVGKSPMTIDPQAGAWLADPVPVWVRNCLAVVALPANLLNVSVLLA